MSSEKNSYMYQWLVLKNMPCGWILLMGTVLVSLVCVYIYIYITVNNVG